MNALVKIIITILLILIALNPYFQEGEVPGGLSELEALGLIPSIILVLTFFIAIAFYLELIHPNNRTRNPKSVWYMYLIPFNFIEDFFIIIDISNSLKKEMKSNDKLKKFGDFGLTLGIGWSVAQLFSFIPNMAGQIAGLVGIVLWVLISKIHKALVISK